MYNLNRPLTYAFGYQGTEAQINYTSIENKCHMLAK
jgi:hypothetical protein